MISLKRKKATKVLEIFGHIDCMYYSTKIVSYSKHTKLITLCTGGYWTECTKKRINQFAKEYSLHFKVVQKDFSWYVVFTTGERQALEWTEQSLTFAL